ncbi:unnamed protein product, partial [marine sediment metagenome]
MPSKNLASLARWVGFLSVALNIRRTLLNPFFYFNPDFPDS